MAEDDGVTQAARSPRNRWFRAGMVILAVFALLGGGVFAYRAWDRAHSARNHIDAAARALAGAEPTVIAVDAAVRSEITAAFVTTAGDAIASAKIAAQALDRAREELDSVNSDVSDVERTRMRALTDSVVARSDMMREAGMILQVDGRAARVLDPTRDAWALVAAAETLTVDSAAAYNKHTKVSVRQSTTLSKQAAGKLSSARSMLETVSAGFPEADMAPFMAYLDARLALIKKSQTIDATWLAGKVDAANKLLDAYNTEEQTVVKQATALRGTPASVLAAAYDALTKDATTRYFKARDAARKADEAVNAAATKK